MDLLHDILAHSKTTVGRQYYLTSNPEEISFFKKSKFYWTTFPNLKKRYSDY